MKYLIIIAGLIIGMFLGRLIGVWAYSFFDNSKNDTTNIVYITPKADTVYQLFYDIKDATVLSEITFDDIYPNASKNDYSIMHSYFQLHKPINKNHDTKPIIISKKEYWKIHKNISKQ